MCGIIGILGQTLVADRLLQGLSRLEYRGYYSAGITVLTKCGPALLRSIGKPFEFSPHAFRITVQGQPK